MESDTQKIEDQAKKLQNLSIILVQKHYWETNSLPK